VEMERELQALEVLQQIDVFHYHHFLGLDHRRVFSEGMRRIVKAGLPDSLRPKLRNSGHYLCASCP
jgi:hypothetical protein